MQFLPITHSSIGAAHDGKTRGLATRIAYGQQPITSALSARATVARLSARGPAGRIESGGPWSDPDVHNELARAIGSAFAPALRKSFDWYMCRGAFFHNDAHYGNVLFGVWYVEGPAIDLVFPRAPARLLLTPGAIAVFDPFEVHGVLHPGATQWQSENYQHDDLSVFVGFELELDAEVCFNFGMQDHVEGPLISSRTRVSATTGALD
jgi:hypothetical protein